MDLKIFIGLFVFLLMSGCEKPTFSYDYLMQHPNVLQDEYQTCEQTKSTDQRCKIVKQATDDFLQLANERNQEPEVFGLKIMQVQIKIAELSQKPESKIEYEKQNQKLASLYAVIAMTSREN